jgi:O-antigen/teichoic acid export membrane protein
MVIKKHMGSLWQTAINFFTKGHQRSLDAKKNIAGALLIKGISIAVSFVMVPLTIHYISPAKYGVWLTLSSIIGWISFFDIGFTHGLRNKFAEAKAKGNTELARIYISTTYFYVSIIFLLLWVLLLSANHFIQWHKLLNLSPADEADVSRLAMLVFTYFCFQFIFRVINTILTADQQPAKASLLDMLGQLLALTVIFILTKTTTGSLLYLGLAAGVMPTLVLLFANLFFFNTRFKTYKPSLKFVKKEYAKDIMKLGGKFFVLQIAAIVQYETSLVLIAKCFNTTEVTNYNIPYKYFSSLHMGFAILLTPLWSGVTDAYNSGDYDWIKNAIKKYLRVLVLFITGGVLMLLLSEKVYDLWLGKNVVQVEFAVSVLCFVFFSTGMFANIFVSVINGIGALKIQFYSAIIASVVFVILAMLFVNVFHLGVKSIVAASILTNVFGYIIAPLQVYKIFYQKSKNPVWYK